MKTAKLTEYDRKINAMRKKFKIIFPCAPGGSAHGYMVKGSGRQMGPFDTYEQAFAERDNEIKHLFLTNED